MPSKLNLIGQKIHRLTVVKDTGKRSLAGCVVYLCLCDCGKECEVNTNNLRSGNSKSCGCWQREEAGNRFRIHGLYNSSIKGIYYAIVARCYNDKDRAYKNYGGRGIIMDDYYLGKEGLMHFAEDIGKIPEGMTVDRIDNSKSYTRGNLRLATREEQNNNRRVNVILEYDGKRMTMAQWSRFTGISKNTLRYRKKVLEWDDEKVLTTPIDEEKVGQVKKGGISV